MLGLDRVTRTSLRRKDETNPQNQEFFDVNPEVNAMEQQHQETTKVRNIEKVEFGSYEI